MKNITKFYANYTNMLRVYICLKNNIKIFFWMNFCPLKKKFPNTFDAPCINISIYYNNYYY